MLLRMIYDDSLAQAAWLIGCQRTGEAIVIDPERDVDRCLDLAEREKMRIVAAGETHIHADYLSGARELAERTGCALYVSGEGGPDWTYGWLGRRAGGGSYNAMQLKDGQTFTIGMIEFKAVHTPGHTPEHICFLVTDRGGGADEPMGALTGDFIFVGDMGRPDLLETAAGQAGAKEPAARALFRSARKFAALPDWIQLWPAHGSGSACGKALGAVPQTTLGYEKRFNPMLRAALASGSTEESFVGEILAGQPEPPLYFGRMKRENRDGPAVLGALPEPREMGAAELASVNGRSGAILDTRPWKDFKAGHIPGSLHAPVDSMFVALAGSYVPAGKPIYLIAGESRVAEIVRLLVRIGLDRFAGWVQPSAVMDPKLQVGALHTAKEIDVEELRSRHERGALVLDVRRASEHEAGHVPGALNINHTDLPARLEEIPKGRPVLVHCRSGARSARAVSLLQHEGFDATNVAGGFLAWEQAGGAVER